jgi:hypothetical protein
MDNVDFAKILNTTGNACGRDRDDFHEEIEKRAAATRRAGESAEKAYTRYITETDAGRELFKAYRNAPAGPEPVQAAQDVEDEPDGDASRELRQMANAMANEMNITSAQATWRLMSDPRRQNLVRRVLAEERSASGKVREQRKPIRLAQEALEKPWRLGSSRGSARM